MMIVVSKGAEQKEQTISISPCVLLNIIVVVVIVWVVGEQSR